MSFILDALRKSEHERQRSAMPGLSHVPLATTRREMPGWAMLVIGALAAAVLVLGGAWWQSQRSLGAPVTTSSAAVAPPVASTPPIAAAPAPIAAPPVAPPISAPATVATTIPPPQAIASTSLLPDSESAAAPAEPQSLADAAFVSKELVPTGPTLPSVTALLAQGIDVPPLKLELHAYSDKPAERFVFINGRKYREGERLTEGPEVVKIELNGVVLSQRGQRFQLAPE